MVGREPNKIKIQHFHSRYNNWPEIGHPIQHKAVLLLSCCQILHMVLQNKGGTPQNRNNNNNNLLLGGSITKSGLHRGPNIRYILS